MIRHLPALGSVVVAAVLLLVPVAMAAERVPVDPQEVLADMERAYRGRTVTEQVEITSRSAGRQNTEPLTLTMYPGEKVRLELGDLTVTADQSALLAVYSKDAKGYFELEPEGGDVLRALGSALPPLPLPQLALGLARPGPDFAALTPYTRGVVWDKAELFSDANPPVVILHGAGVRCDAEYTIHAETGRLIRASFRLDGGRSEIDVRCEPVPDAEPRAFALNVKGRERVPTISDLRFRPTDIAVGDRLPELAIIPADIDAPRPDFNGPGVILFMRGWSQAAADAVAAVAAARTGTLNSLALWPVAVLDELETDAREHIDTLQPLVAPSPLYVTRTPLTTALRFAPGAGALAVVLDGSRTVRAVLVLDPVAPAHPDLPALAQARKPDPARAAGIARQIRTALGADASLIGP